MWIKDLWEERIDVCDQAEQQKQAVFNLTMTQAVHALGR